VEVVRSIRSVVVSKIMKIKIASKNPAKIEALKEIIADYQNLKDTEIVSEEIPSGVNDQPKSLDQTVLGAINRSKNIHNNDCSYSFGIESGLMKVPNTKSGYMDVCACSIFDGKECHIGLSSAWEAPQIVNKYIIEDGMNMNDAAHKAGLTENSKIGSAEGLIGIMTKGRLTRKDYTKEAIRTALIHIDVN
jgi:inosine/xanthosine triphosphatase